jgi:hypothetical protein
MIADIADFRAQMNILELLHPIGVVHGTFLQWAEVLLNERGRQLLYVEASTEKKKRVWF